MSLAHSLAALRRIQFFLSFFKTVNNCRFSSPSRGIFTRKKVIHFQSARLVKKERGNIRGAVMRRPQKKMAAVFIFGGGRGGDSTNQTTSRVIICGAHAPMASEGRRTSFVPFFYLKKKPIKRVDVGVTFWFTMSQPPVLLDVIFLLDASWRRGFARPVTPPEMTEYKTTTTTTWDSCLFEMSHGSFFFLLLLPLQHFMIFSSLYLAPLRQTQ